MREDRLAAELRQAGVDAVPSYRHIPGKVAQERVLAAAGFYTPGWIRQYPVFFSETTLYDVLKDEVVWTATIRTIDPDNIDEATENYVETVAEALKQKNLLSRSPAQQGSTGR